MEFLSAEFFAALGAIILIDLVLAGDNAIVIALAARNLPPHLQKRAIIWGTFGAIAVRAAMTVVVVALLKIPGLMLAGGLLLLWIAYRLLVPEEKAGEGHAHAASNFWGAMRTIVIADAVMGLDNVLAVAGAAHGSYLLVVLGLLISIPIVVWGSTIILKWVERFPVIIYLGAGVLAATSAKMVSGEPIIKPYLESAGFIVPLLYLVFIGGILWAGLVQNRRRLESRVTRALADRDAAPAAPTLESNLENGVPAMQKILVPVDGSKNSLHAVRHALQRFMAEPVEIHLLNVQQPFSRHISQFAARKARVDYHREKADRALAGARELLKKHNVPYAEHLQVGDRAKVIAAEAKRLRCQRIVMSSARRNSFTRMLDLSVTQQVLEHTTVPVEVIAGDAVSPAERIGVPACLGAAIAVLIAAAAD